MFKSEKALLEGVIEAVQALDPDIVLGFEVQQGSLGYLADRAASMEMGLLKLVSRTPEVLPLCHACRHHWPCPSCVHADTQERPRLVFEVPY